MSNYYKGIIVGCTSVALLKIGKRFLKNNKEYTKIKEACIGRVLFFLLKKGIKNGTIKFDKMVIEYEDD